MTKFRDFSPFAFAILLVPLLNSPIPARADTECSSQLIVNNLCIGPFANLKKSDLRGRDMHGVDLFRADFRIANLSEIDLSGANLSGASFGAASLRNADFSGARLIGANFWGADLTGADFSGADLRRAIFWEAILLNTDFIGADLRDADLRKADLTQCYADGVDFSNTLRDEHTKLPEPSQWLR